MCHVDALLCCVFSFSSDLFVILLMFLLRTQRIVVIVYVVFTNGESVAQSGEAMQVLVQK